MNESMCCISSRISDNLKFGFVAANRSILILEGLPMAHLKAYVPNFPKHMRERSQSLKLWVLDLSEVR